MSITPNDLVEILSNSTFQLSEGDGLIPLRGRRGKRGKPGLKGDDGVGISHVFKNSDNELVILLDNDESINLGKLPEGPKGEPGEPGKPGKNGDPGSSIIDAKINSKGELILTRTGGIKDNLGRVVGKDGENATSTIIGGGLPIGGNPGDILVRNDAFGGSASWASVDSTIENLEFDYIDFDLSPSPTVTMQEGRMAWDDEAGTVQIGMPGGTVVLDVGQEQLLRARNTTGATITNGSIVYITGASGNKPLIALAQADDESTSDTTIAIATEDIANNSNGYVTTFGLVRELDTSAFAEGTFLYLSASVAGAFVGTPPSPPNHEVRIGVVLRQHANQGIILFELRIGSDLEGLHDVVVTSPSSNQVIKYNSVNQTWDNGFVAESEVTFTDITTNNSSTSQHGYLPKLSGDSTQFLNGEGNYVTPSGTTNSYVSQSFSSSTSVVVTHNFGVKPAVTVWIERDGSTFVDLPNDIEENSVNQFTVTFTSAKTGTIVASVGSPQPQKYIIATSDYSAVSDDYFIEETGAGSTITLLSSIETGKIIHIDNNSTGDIYAVVDGGGTINGNTQQVIKPNDNMMVSFNGSEYRIK